ncbi:hypothetical protein ACJ41O_009023 [Fusarium nematophilum]
MSSKANPVASEASLVALPYELREQIFHCYFKADGGYVYDAESDKLVTADGQAIDLSLMYTCHSIADNTRHIPLAINTITFSTTYRKDWRTQAGGLAFIVGYHHALQVDMLDKLSYLITPEMFSQLGQKFPQHMPDIQRRLVYEQRRHRPWRRPPPFIRRRSAFQNFLGRWSYNGILSATTTIFGMHSSDVMPSIFGAVAYTLRLVAEKHPTEFMKVLDRVLPGWTNSHPLCEFFDLSFDPWAIPSLPEVVGVSNQLQAHQFWKCFDGWYHHREHEGTGDRYREILYFSAAAIAIRFLDQLPKQQRLHIRNIILKEDQVAVGHPECHVLGLIPFCRENRRLHVERRVNLWRSIILQRKPPSPRKAVELAETERQGPNQTSAFGIKSKLIHWLSHALEVMDQGMPAGSFSFVLDGEPDLNLSSDVFDKIIHGAIAWQKSLSECVARGLFPHADRHGYFLSERAVQCLELLLSGTSIFRSNFNLGLPWDYEKLIVEHQDPSEQSWMHKINNTGPQYFDIPNPTLDLTKLKLELFEKQSQSDYLHSSLNPCKREKKRLRRVRRTWAAAEAEADSGLDSDSDTDVTPELRFLFGEPMAWSEKRERRRARRQKRKRRNERREQRAAAEPGGAEDLTERSETELAGIKDTASDV